MDAYKPKVLRILFYPCFISLFQFSFWGIIYSEIMRSCLAVSLV